MSIAGVFAALRSPLGLVVLGAVAALTIGGVLLAEGYSLGMERCQRDQLLAELAAVERDRSIAAAAATEAEALLADLETRNQTLEALVDDQATALAGDPDRCVWAPDQLDRLHDILGR